MVGHDAPYKRQEERWISENPPYKRRRDGGQSPHYERKGKMQSAEYKMRKLGE
jgi:hypothetical protein